MITTILTPVSNSSSITIGVLSWVPRILISILWGKGLSAIPACNLPLTQIFTAFTLVSSLEVSKWSSPSI